MQWFVGYTHKQQLIKSWDDVHFLNNFVFIQILSNHNTETVQLHGHDHKHTVLDTNCPIFYITPIKFIHFFPFPLGKCSCVYLVMQTPVTYGVSAHLPEWTRTVILELNNINLTSQDPIYSCTDKMENWKRDITPKTRINRMYGCSPNTNTCHPQQFNLFPNLVFLYILAKHLFE